MPSQTNITPPRVPLTDARNGFISREWYRFFLSLFDNTGGGSGITPVENGGTGAANVATAGTVLYGDGGSFVPTAVGTPGYVLTSSGSGAPVWAASSGSGTVTSVDVSGGTTGLSASGGPITGSGTITLGGTLAIANGGTNGTATPTAGAVPYGTGTAYAFTAAGTAGQVLISSGAAAPTWGSAARAAETTVDFGATPTDDTSFVVADANITAASTIEAFVMADSTADNDADDHRFAAISLRFSALPAAGSFTLYASALYGLVTGTFKIRYLYS